MKKILVPYDFSEVADNALIYASHLAANFSADLTILHVAQIPVMSSEFGMITGAYPADEDGHKSKMTQLANDIKVKYSAIKNIEIHYELGNATDAIIDYTFQKKFDLIVMGISGHGSQFMKVTFGSTAVSVSKQIATPMIIVPPKYQYKNIKLIAYACDYDEHIESSEALIRVKELNSLFDANLQILHVVPEGHELNKTESIVDRFIEKKLENNKHITYTISSNNISNALLGFVSEHHSDMIIVEPKTHTIFHNLLLPSITNNVAFFSAVPVLVI